MCPHCNAPRDSIKKMGFYTITIPRLRRRRRYFCNACRRSFSRQTLSVFRGESTSQLNGAVFRLLCAGVSQRECARIVELDPKTIARKLVRLGEWAKANNRRALEKSSGDIAVVFDEMESFEHTKCKPLSIAVAVEKSTRRVLWNEVSSMPAKGRLAAIAKKKYGFRRDNRRRGLKNVLKAIKKSQFDVKELHSDLCPRYPKLVRAYFPGVEHIRYKGRRGCVVGQGELKRGGFDPLFSLNHTCAMFRDRVKRLSRRTWCTTKRPDRLGLLMHMYAYHHNEYIKREG